MTELTNKSQNYHYTKAIFAMAGIARKILFRYLLKIIIIFKKIF